MKRGTYTEGQRMATKAERAKVAAWVRKWQHELYLHILRINVFFHSTPKDGEDDGPSWEEKCSAMIDCTIADIYHEATLNVYPRFFEDNDEEDQEFIVVHELMHIIVAPLHALLHRQSNGGLVTPEEARREDERATDHLARVIFFGGTAKESEKPMKRGAIKARLRK